LRYLDEVARCGSIRKASGRLHVAASAINRQILALEDELGTPIFQRLPQRMVLTAAGEVLVAHIRQTLRAMIQAKSQIDEIKGMKRGEMALAVVSGLAGTLVPLAIARFREIHPRVMFNVALLPTDGVVSAVDSGEADLGLGFNLPVDHRLKVFASAPSRLGAVVRSDHPLAALKTLRFADCVAYPLCIADDAMAIRSQLDSMSAEADVAIEPLIETNSVEVMRQMVTTQNCVTFFSKFEIYLEKTGSHLVYLPLEDAGSSTESILLVGRHKNPNGLVEGMASTIGDILRDYADRF
jgi:DNA-binding transcriptional LysR family regulator